MLHFYSKKVRIVDKKEGNLVSKWAGEFEEIGA